MAVSISFLYMSFDRIFGPVLSRLVILPLAVAVSFMRDVDMLSYNSEHPVILLLCIAFFFLSRVYSSGPGRYNARLISLGFILGAVPFAKLQGVPMAFFIGLFGCFVVYQTLSIKCLLVLMVSALMPALMILLTVSLYGGLESFWMSYIKFNLFYASESTVSGFGQRMAMLFQIMDVPKELHFFLFYSFSVIIIGLFLILSLAKISRVDFVKLLFSIILLCITIFCIVAPGRTLIIHYLLLLLIPLTLLVAVVVDCVCKSTAHYLSREQPFASFFLNLQAAVIYIFISGLYHFHMHFTFKPSFLERAAARYEGYCPQGDAVAVLNHYFSPGSKMAIWGWGTELWAGTNFLMGTRDGNTGFLIDENPLQGYYGKRFLDDLQENKPELFVEAVAPNFFRYHDRTKQGFKNSPLIKEYIDEHYRWEAEVGGIQIYLRKDMNPIKKPFVSHSPKPLTATKEFHCSLEEIIRNGSFLQFRGWTVVGDNTTNQSVMLALINERDTFLVKSYQIANKSVVDFSPLNRNNLMCGYLGFIPEQEIPPGHYQVGIYVENKGETGFKLMNRMLTFDPLLPTQKSF